MSESDRPDEHVFTDPDEALAHFTPEAMAAARARSMTLGPDGRHLDPGTHENAPDPVPPDATS